MADTITESLSALSTQDEKTVSPSALPSTALPLIIDDSAFNTFATMRTGIKSSSCKEGGQDEKRNEVFFYCVGELYDGQSGELMAFVEGYDAATAYWVGDGHVRQLSRKIFFLRDPHTNEIMEQHTIKYAYQILEYKRGPNGTILPSAVQGSGAQQRTIPCMAVTARRVGEHTVFQAPLFIDVEIPGRGRYQSWEIYDFTLDPSYSKAPYLTWVRYGPSMGKQNTTMHLTGSRMSSFASLPSTVRDFVKGDLAQWKAPPVDMNEIESLQQADAIKRAK